MAWTGLVLTVDGRNALNQAQMDNRLNIKSIVVGDGAAPSNFHTQKKLVHQLYELTELKIDVTEDSVTLTADFPNINYDYYFREVGVIVTTKDGDKLYVYDNSGNDAQYIISTTGAETTEKRLQLSLIISDVAEITISKPSVLYVDYHEFENVTEELKRNKIDCDGGDISDTVVAFEEAETVENINSGEKQSVIFSKIQKIITNVLEHFADTSKHVTLKERTLWNTVTDKVDKRPDKDLSDNNYTTEEKNKLAGIEEGANKYVHPSKHLATEITQDSLHRFISDSEKDVWNSTLNSAKDYSDATYQQSTGYTDKKIADLIGGAPETLDTLKEVADAISENKDVVDALNAAIGKKANQAELDSHIKNTIHITANERNKWNNASEHAFSTHAPSNAERNTVVGVQKNGIDISPDINRKVNIIVPTKVSQLINDSGFKTTDTKNTTGAINKTETKMHLIAAPIQDKDTTTYSNSGCYIGTDNELYSNGKKVCTSSLTENTIDIQCCCDSYLIHQSNGINVLRDIYENYEKLHMLTFYIEIRNLDEKYCINNYSGAHKDTYDMTMVIPTYVYNNYGKGFLGSGIIPSTIPIYISLFKNSNELYFKFSIDEKSYIYFRYDYTKNNIIYYKNFLSFADGVDGDVNENYVRIINISYY